MNILVEKEELNLRLDQLLAKKFQGHYSRTYFQRLIEEGFVLVNGLIVKKRTKLQFNDEIEVEFTVTPEMDLEPENIPLEILYEDNDILAINKPIGMVVHPAPGNWLHTFVHALLFHCKELSVSKDDLRPGIVHRLDKDTTGVLLAAKHPEAQRRLIQAFSERKIEKTYLAVVYGHPPDQVISSPIGRDPRYRQKMAVNPQGKPARTKIKTLFKGKEVSCIQIGLETGRTHQIRVHLASIGAPVLGDPLYGNRSANDKFLINSQLLHAQEIQFFQPMTGASLTISAKTPESFKRFCQ